jgi:hypothetical protein
VDYSIQKQKRNHLHRQPNMGDHHLGVSVHHIVHDFLSDIQSTEGLSEKSKFYEIENLREATGFIREKGAGLTCPVDGRTGTAYVHCLEGGEDHVGKATHMLSWTWTYNVKDVVQ